MDIAHDIALKLRANAPMKEEEAKLFVEEQLQRLPPHRRGPVVQQLLTQFNQEVSQITEHRAKTARLKGFMEDFLCWWEGDFVLEKNDCSRFHKLQEAAAKNDIYGWNAENEFGPVPAQDSIAKGLMHCFVVKHNWADAFAGTEVVEGDIVAPYELCNFEFRYSGHTVIAMWSSYDNERCALLSEFGDFWVVIGTFELQHKLISEVRKQIRAICISLDAEVATRDVVRAPAKLNKKRAERGLPLLNDFHVVDLAKRHRIANPARGSGEPSHHKRLHFVRGHWRHYEVSKTWIKWHLRGNPDLGFIAKHYSL